MKECALCGRNESYVTLDAHHTYRRRNSNETIYLCNTPHPYHKLSCHKLAHLNIKLAKELGIYKVYDINLENKNNEFRRSDTVSVGGDGINQTGGNPTTDNLNQGEN